MISETSLDMNMAKVVVAGSYLVALVMEVKRIPSVGETVHGKNYFQTHGGKGSNMAIQVARLGAQCSFVGSVGDDSHGNHFMQLLKKEGIEASGLKQRRNSATGVGFIMVDPAGQNVISIDSGANALFSLSDINEAASSWQGSGAILTQFEVPIETAFHAMKVGKKRGYKTILNPAPAEVLIDRDLSSVSVITPNETEAHICLGLAPDKLVDEEELALRLLELGCGAALVTLGERGCICATAKDGVERVEAFTVAEVVDTTGAGDAFNAALAVGLAEGAALMDAARFANAAAALACTRMDTLPSYHIREQVMDFAGSNFKT